MTTHEEQAAIAAEVKSNDMLTDDELAAIYDYLYIDSMFEHTIIDDDLPF
jgi:hypothetical protein